VNATEALCHLLQISFRPGFRKWTPKPVFSFEDDSYVIRIPYTFELLWNTRNILDTHRAQRLSLFVRTTVSFEINNWLNETLRITVELKITFQATNFIKQILPFLAYGGSSIVKILNPTSLHMRRMVRFDVYISVSVCEFSVNFGGQCRPLPDDQNIQNRTRTVWLYFIKKWIEGLKLLRWRRKFCNSSAPWDQTTNLSVTHRSHSNGLYCAKSRAFFSKYSM
jgi:hypothetical protein